MNFPISSVNRPGHPTGATLKICAVQVFNVADAVSCMWNGARKSRGARPVTRTGGVPVPVCGSRACGPGSRLRPQTPPGRGLAPRGRAVARPPPRVLVLGRCARRAVTGRHAGRSWSPAIPDLIRQELVNSSPPVAPPDRVPLTAGSYTSIHTDDRSPVTRGAYE